MQTSLQFALQFYAIYQQDSTPPLYQSKNACHNSLFCTLAAKSKIKEFLQFRSCVIWVSDCVTDCSWIRVDFMIVSANLRLVAEEMDGSVFDSARELSFVLEVLEAVSLVPAVREDVEGELAAD
jgi:hypothetical protein